MGEVLVGTQRAEYGLDHERSGDIILIADQDSWFTYYFWNDDQKAPDYARTVDIHKAFVALIRRNVCRPQIYIP